MKTSDVTKTLLTQYLSDKPSCFNVSPASYIVTVL